MQASGCAHASSAPGGLWRLCSGSQRGVLLPAVQQRAHGQQNGSRRCCGQQHHCGLAQRIELLGHRDLTICNLVVGFPFVGIQQLAVPWVLRPISRLLVDELLRLTALLQRAVTPQDVIAAIRGDSEHELRPMFRDLPHERDWTTRLAWLVSRVRLEQAMPLLLMESALFYVFRSERGGPLSVDVVQLICKRAGEFAGLPFRVHPHQVRHACGFFLAEEGVDTQLIQSYLGHASISNTVIYTETSARRFASIRVR